MERSRLAAYVDGHLEPEEAAAVVMHLADNPEDQAYVDHLNELNGILSTAFDAPAQAPVPQHIYETIFPPRRNPLQSWTQALSGWLAPAGLGLTVAATAAFVIFGSGNPETPPIGLHTGLVPGDSELHAMLETQPSGHTGPIENELVVTLIAVFFDADHRPCREYELQHGGEDIITRGIACRRMLEDQGAWEVAITASERIGQFESGLPNYVPAQGPSHVAVSTALDALGAGPSLTPSAERELLAASWD